MSSSTFNSELACFSRRSALFGFVLWGCLVAFDAALPYYWADKTLAAKVRHLDGIQWEDVDTVFVGSSLTFNQVAPDVFDPITGSNSFNLGTGGAHGLAICRIASELISRQGKLPLKTIVVEVRHPTVSQAVLHNGEGYYAFDVQQSLFACRYHGSSGGSRTQLKRSLMSSADNLTKRGTGFSFLDAMYGPIDRRLLGPRLDGYLPLVDGVVSGIRFETDKGIDELRELARKERRGDQPHESDTIYANHLRSMQEAAGRCGIRMVFILPPKTIGLAAVARILGPSRVIDLGDPVRFPELFDASITFDVMHFNSEGARVYSTILASELQRLNAIALDSE